MSEPIFPTLNRIHEMAEAKVASEKDKAVDEDGGTAADAVKIAKASKADKAGDQPTPGLKD